MVAPCFVWHFGKASSSLDVAYRLAMSGKLAEWDSVLVASQSSGRGQMRRRWFSPVGNIYAALRLPCSPPFLTTAAASATGGLLACALAHMGLQVCIKWPNDIVLLDSGTPKKVAGILIEERNGVLLAGVGINVFHSPPADFLREGAALAATSLCESSPDFMRQYETSDQLWLSLVKHAYSVYNTNGYSENWRDVTEHRLLWRYQSVQIHDGLIQHKGRLVGISPLGELILDHNGLQQLCHSGSLGLAD